MAPSKEAWHFIQESFYEDYTDTCNTGDAKNEVPITNLAKIDFPGEQKQNLIAASTPQLGGISGTKVPLNQRQGKGNKSMKSQTTTSPSKERRTMQATVRGSSLPVFKQWLKVASSQERDVVLRMLQAGYTADTEEVRLKKAVGKVLRPDSAVKVQEWLKSASESERQVVLNVLERLIEATNDVTDSEYLAPNHYYYASGFGHHRSHTYPMSLGRHRVPHLKGSKQKIRCRRCSTAKRNEGCDDGGLGLIGKRIAMDSSKKSKHLIPQLWHNRILQQHGGATIVHAAGVFSQPKKDRGQHYSIHPEWPTA